MSLRTRKQKSKIDFAFFDKSNKMVSGVKLILTKQNPRRLNKAQRAPGKNHDYKTAATTSLHTKRNSFSLLFFYTANSFSKHGTRTCGKETDATETNPAGSMVATDRTIYTMDTAVLVPSQQEEPLAPACWSLGNPRFQPAAGTLLGHSSVCQSVRSSSAQPAQFQLPFPRSCSV